MSLVILDVFTSKTFPSLCQYMNSVASRVAWLLTMDKRFVCNIGCKVISLLRFGYSVHGIVSLI